MSSCYVLIQTLNIRHSSVKFSLSLETAMSESVRMTNITSSKDIQTKTYRFRQGIITSQQVCLTNGDRTATKMVPTVNRAFNWIYIDQPLQVGDQVCLRVDQFAEQFQSKLSTSPTMKIMFRTCVLDAELKNKRKSVCAKFCGTRNDVCNDCRASALIEGLAVVGSTVTLTRQLDGDILVLAAAPGGHKIMSKFLAIKRSHASREILDFERLYVSLYMFDNSCESMTILDDVQNLKTTNEASVVNQQKVSGHRLIRVTVDVHHQQEADLLDFEPPSNKCCVVCLEKSPDAAFANCGHNSCCFNCAHMVWQSQGQCPMCRQPIDNILKLFN